MVSNRQTSRPSSAAQKPKPQVQQGKKKQSCKQVPQKYSLKNDVTLCTRGCSAGRKIAKTMVLGE